MSARQTPMPVHEFEDEMGISVDITVNRNLADVRDKGVMKMAGFQSLEMVTEIYGESFVKSIASMWKTIVAFRGIADKATLELLSTLIGTYEKTVLTYSQGRDHRGNLEWLAHEERVVEPRMHPHEIGQGHPYLPDAALVIAPGLRWFWVEPRPLYRGEPWPRTVISSLEDAVAQGVYLPVLPDFTRYGSYAHLEPLGLSQRFYDLCVANQNNAPKALDHTDEEGQTDA